MTKDLGEGWSEERAACEKVQKVREGVCSGNYKYSGMARPQSLNGVGWGERRLEK